MSNANEAELARAFSDADAIEKPSKQVKRTKRTKLGRAPIVVLLVGVAALMAGVVVLVMNLSYKPGRRDAEYLVEVGTWQLEGEPGVIWQFTEIGKGTLTTNNHINDYDFIWAITGDNLAIETNWLYRLENSYSLAIDQVTERLTLTEETGEGAKTVTFVATK